MFQDSTPPLFRGIGTTVILVATVISFSMARHPGGSPLAYPGRPGPGAAMTPRVAELEREVAELRREAADDHLVEEVIGNPWFEVLGFIGTGFIGASFYLEWWMRRGRARV